MPSAKKARPLTAQFIDSFRSRNEAEDFSDLAVRGLLLRVERTGYKHWLFRYKLNKRPRRLRLGDYPEVTPAARKRAARYRALLEAGMDPQMARLFGRRNWDLRPAAGSERRRVGSAPLSTDIPVEAHPHSIERLLAKFKTLFVAAERAAPDVVEELRRRGVDVRPV